MSNLLIHEPPLQVLPSLAVKIGLNEAIVLQQLHYWLEKSRNEKEGRLWVYNTSEDWRLQFTFWSEKTIIRAFKSLEDKKLIITGNFNKMPMDRTKWYTIDYTHLDKLSESCGQNDRINRTKSTNGTGQNDLSNNHRIPETNTKDIYINYADDVKMKEKEYIKLVEKYGEEQTKQMIEVLDNYKGANGKKYKSDYKAILSWVKDKVLNEQPKQQKKQEPQGRYIPNEFIVDKSAGEDW